jgi:ABC-2 type transport system ATP-binding protein
VNTQTPGEVRSPAIEARDLAVSFETRGGTVAALRGISFTVPQGQVVGFLGPNGAGKTTTLHVLLGFQPPTAGRAAIFGDDVTQSFARRRLGYMPEHPQSYPYLTGREFLHLMGGLFGLPDAWTSRRPPTAAPAPIRAACSSASASRRR